MSKLIRAVEAAELLSEKTGIPIGELVDLFAEIPSVDAEEVVRCRDCMHGREQNAEEKVVSQLLPEILICNHPDVSEYCWQGVWPNHYCSYAERREEG